MISQFKSFIDKIKINLSENCNYNYGYHVDDDLIDDTNFIYTILFKK